MEKERKINVLSLFDGMSCGQIALNKLGIGVGNYYASEIDKYAMSATNRNFPNTNHLGDVSKLNTDNLPKIDLLMGGSPCTNFSFAGSQKGMSTNDNIEILTLEHYLELKDKGYEFEGQSYLFWEYIHILRKVKPKYFLLENVRMSNKWEKVISDTLGVEPIKINSSLVSAQTRNRLYWTNIPNVDQPVDKDIKLKDVMLSLTDDKLELKRPTPKRIKYIKRKVDKGWLKREYKDTTVSKSDCLLASMYKQLQEFVWLDESGKKRFFTPVECERLQNVPDNYTQYGIINDKVKKTSNTQRYRMLGNGWTVDVVAHILKNIK